MALHNLQIVCRSAEKQTREREEKNERIPRNSRVDFKKGRSTIDNNALCDNAQKEGSKKEENEKVFVIFADLKIL